MAAPPARPLRRATRILLWTLLALGLLVAGCVVAISLFDWNRAKPWISQRVTDATGRSFEIRGDLSLRWHNPRTEQGWRRWVPWPRLRAEQLLLGNAEWSRSGLQMAELSALDVSLNPLWLLQHTVYITELELDGPTLALERQADGRNNWTFPTQKKDGSEDAGSAWKVKLDRLVLRKGTISIDDAVQQIDVKAQIESLEPSVTDAPASGPYGIRWEAKGSYRRQPLQGSGKAGAVLSLADANAPPYPLQASVRAGRTRAEVEGTLTRPQSLAAIDLRLKLSGESMADLHRLTGITLPKTPPYATQGRLRGELDKANQRWVYEGFEGRVGQSDIGGTLEYLSRPERPLLRGNVRSRLLRFDDLAPLIGAGPDARKAAPEPVRAQPGDKALPVIAFDTKSWGSMDADVKFEGQKIVRDPELPIDSLVTQVTLTDRVLSLKPLNFGVAGGTLASTVQLDARSGTILADTRMQARRLRIQKLFPTLESMRGSFGELNGDMALAGKGNSVAAMLGSANGEVKALVSQGSLSKFILEAAGLNIGSLVVTQLFGDKQVQLNCLATDFKVTNGLMESRIFVLDTEDSTIYVQGTINLNNENLELEVVPRNKKLRIISLRSPLHVTGTFKNPRVGLDAGTLALKIGSAVALAAAAPVSALLPLSSLGNEEEQAACRPLLAEVKQRAVAPKAK